ncbi:MAG: hypothetical protein QXV17_07335 [Candidatus Micrarchaeaceae archaeon]
MEQRLDSIEEKNIHNILDKIYTGINNSDMIEIWLNDKSVIELYPDFRNFNNFYPLGKDKIMIEYSNGEQIKLVIKSINAIILNYFGEGFYDVFNFKEM